MRLPPTTTVRPESVLAQPRVVAPDASTAPVLGTEARPSSNGPWLGIYPPHGRDPCGCERFAEPQRSYCRMSCGIVSFPTG